MKKLFTVLIFASCVWAQTENHGTVGKGVQDNSGATRTAPAKSGNTLPATCTLNDQFFKSNATAGQNLYGCTATDTWSLLTGGGSPVRSLGWSFDGGGATLTAGATGYFTVPFACTIAAWNIVVDAGTATVDVWKIATGTAIPTISNTITASATPAISTGTAIHSTTLTGWTVSVSTNDIIGINLKVVSTATFVNLTLQCN
jgi:hypothetical protein